MSASDRQLRWVSKNRRRRQSSETLAELVDAFPIARWKRQSRRWEGVVRVLNEILGAEIVNGLSIVSRRGGVLVLETDDASAACTFEYRYALRIAEALQVAEPGSGVRQVRFRQRVEGLNPSTCRS